MLRQLRFQTAIDATAEDRSAVIEPERRCAVMRGMVEVGAEGAQDAEHPLDVPGRGRSGARPDLVAGVASQVRAQALERIVACILTCIVTCDFASMAERVAVLSGGAE